ncbi:hypothetical protein HanRHA438_Chr00c22g0852971 [Helianthus annuus]|nr:hypothetical protein HanRHA438_Chr00c22g0852971 [Helianthus annuus]
MIVPPLCNAIQPYKMTELAFSLTEKWMKLTQWTKMATVKPFWTHRLKMKPLTKLAKWPKPQGLKWHLTQIIISTRMVPSFFQKYMDGPCGLHFVTHLVPNLDMLRPLDMLAGD